MPDSMSSPARILFVDDDDDVRKAAALLLTRHGMTLVPARGPDEAISLLALDTIDAILLDLNFSPGARSGAEGLACLERLIGHDPDAAVVVVTGHSGISIAVAAMRAGATDFVMKPWNSERLVAALRAAVGRRQQRLAARHAGEAVAPSDDPPMIGDSAALRQALALALRVAASDAAVLLSGPAGTGKTTLARFIHRHSGHAGGQLCQIDAPALWQDSEAALLTALRAADAAGTLLLDGLDRLPPAAQARLLAWLSAKPGPRLLAESRRPGAALADSLSAELLYRLSTVEIALPPLHERGEDVERLARHFLRLFARQHARPEPVLADDAVAAIRSAAWPGQVRELRQTMERAVVLGSGDPLHAASLLPPAPPAARPQAPADLTLERTERAAIEAALRRHGFNITRAAKDLGLTRAALYRRMARHGF